jgi:hypothetical protein
MLAIHPLGYTARNEAHRFPPKRGPTISAEETCDTVSTIGGLVEFLWVTGDEFELVVWDEEIG